MKAKYIEIENEKIYLKKSVLFGWSVVYPNINNDGSINWMNVIFGGKYNLIKLIFLEDFFVGLQINLIKLYLQKWSMQNDNRPSN